MRDASGHRRVLEDALRLAGDGKVTPVEPTEYPFDRVGEALTALLERKVTGKLAIVR
jgi:D-arabinose 1-dehydrogenase-like Zn-dependent alcohol dehydrogenase